MKEIFVFRTVVIQPSITTEIDSSYETQKRPTYANFSRKFGDVTGNVLLFKPSLTVGTDTSVSGTYNISKTIKEVVLQRDTKYMKKYSCGKSHWMKIITLSIFVNFLLILLCLS